MESVPDTFQQTLPELYLIEMNTFPFFGIRPDCQKNTYASQSTVKFSKIIEKRVTQIEKTLLAITSDSL